VNAVNAWLEIRAGGEWQRHELRPGLTKIGGPAADIPLAGGPEGRTEIDGELHVFDDPPRVVRVTGPELCGVGAPTTQLPLSDGTRFSWGGVELCYSRGAPVLEEIPIDDEPIDDKPAAGPEAGRHEADPSAEHSPDEADEWTSDELRAWRRVQAGLLVELGLAERGVARRWQEAVKSSRFEADTCSREILSETRFDADDPRLVDRCGALLRDLLMAPLLRGTAGAGRRARGAAKNGVAFLLAQLIAIAVYSLLIAVLLILLRANWDVSLDGLIDGLLG